MEMTSWSHSFLVKTQDHHQSRAFQNLTQKNATSELVMMWNVKMTNAPSLPMFVHILNWLMAYSCGVGLFGCGPFSLFLSVVCRHPQHQTIITTTITTW
jgi:hypothetical protein